ncbi:MAG: proteasome accessory factor PafA2 family protein [Candidatus Portnoybacteria bacterium]|nr:proteasome accessory factor PafA2 family protein [Candidatus Portnoybacteria bacterium]
MAKKMARKPIAVPPYMGEEIEADIIIRMPDETYRLPDPRELFTMIKLFREDINYPLPNQTSIYELIENLRRDSQDQRERDAKERIQGMLDSGISFLPSGFRLYLDCYHLEISSPGCANIHDLIVSSRVAEKMLNRMRCLLENHLNENQKGHRVKIFKDTTDRQKASYAGHENYLIHRKSFHLLTDEVTNKTLQFASFVGPWRIPLTGAGKLGSQNDLPPTYYQISQRADWIEKIIGIDTTFRRPLINTRDEAHAKYTLVNGKKAQVARLHHICGEPNMSPASARMRFGYTSLFLLGLQDDIFDEIQDNIIAANPVEAMHIVSRDILGRETIELMNGKKAKFYEVLRVINDCLRWYFMELREPTQEQLDLLDEMEYYCDSFAKGPKFYLNKLMELDWIHRLQLCNLVAGGPEKKYTDLAYSDIDPDESGYYQDLEFLKESNEVKERDLIDEKEIDRRFENPPTTSRDFLRGNILKKFPAQKSDWETIRLPNWDTLYLEDPHRGGKDEIGDLVENSDNGRELFEKLKTLEFEVFIDA